MCRALRAAAAEPPVRCYDPPSWRGRSCEDPHREPLPARHPVNSGHHVRSRPPAPNATAATLPQAGPRPKSAGADARSPAGSAR
ncbi:hypothetical protein KNE206_65260 [Kitasatospora sp. NE20-6]